MNKNIACIAAVFLSGILSAEEFNYSKTEHFAHSNPAVKLPLTDKGEGVISASGNMAFYSTPAVPVDPAKKYTITGTFRKTAGAEAPVFFGWAYYDKDGRYFDNAQVNVVKGSDTELVEALEKGSTELVLKDGSAWSGCFQGKHIAFNTDPSYKDLPNFNLFTEGIESVKQADGKWLVTLKKPSKAAYPAGTKCRIHQPGGTVYIAANRKPKERWITFKSAPVSGIKTTPGLSNTQFPVGTASVKILLFVNYGKANDTTTEFKDIKLTVE